MASFVVDAGDCVIGGNLIISEELNCYGNISSKINSKLNVCLSDDLNIINVITAGIYSTDSPPHQHAKHAGVCPQSYRAHLF